MLLGFNPISITFSVILTECIMMFESIYSAVDSTSSIFVASTFNKFESDANLNPP